MRLILSRTAIILNELLPRFRAILIARYHDVAMLDDLKELVNDIDTIERQVYRQQAYASDPNLKSWCSVSGRELADIKAELQGYIRRVEAAGQELR